MSEVARELKMLFYLDSKLKFENLYVKISELADYLEISERQVRRYRDDLEQNGFYIDSIMGPHGGYRLIEKLDESLMIPDNIMLAISLTMKNNDSLLKSLHNLSVVPNVAKRIDGDAYINDHDLDVLTTISEAIADSKMVRFDYDMNHKSISMDVEPYKIYYTQHTYYLRGVSVYKQELRKYDISRISNIKSTDSFVSDESIVKKTNEEISVYGIMDEDKPNVLLHLKYFDSKDVSMIDRYFEHKGTIDEKEMTYTVTVKDNAESFYVLFALHNKIEIVDEDIKRHYINYMKNHIRKLED